MNKNIVLTLLCVLSGSAWGAANATGRIGQGLAGLYKAAKFVAKLPAKGVKMCLAYPDYMATMAVPALATYWVLAPSEASTREFARMVNDEGYAQVQAAFGRQIARRVSLVFGLACGAIYHGLRAMGGNATSTEQSGS
jgi:hypothetical protein